MRDPNCIHSDADLREALWHVAAGGDLRPGDPLRDELLHLGFLRRDATGDEVHVTPQGRHFCEAADTITPLE